jgi:carbamoyltransferase
MYVLGIHGGQLCQDQSDPVGHLFHDSAAVLLRDGEVVAAIEEERLDRIKHSNCFPFQAVNRCLQIAGIGLDEVDRIAINISRYVANAIEKNALLMDSQYRLEPDGEVRLADLFQRSFGVDIRGKVWFCNHHMAHAWSAFGPTPFEESLILTIDGDGDNSSGMVLVGKGNQITKLREYSVRQSLGRLYHTLILFLGYRRFDEFKVMGLAPYGDPSVFRALFSSCYRLLPDGDYMLDEAPSWFAKFEAAGLLKHARRRSDPFTELHKNFAAALQETVEKIVLHVLTQQRRLTRQRNLCLAGGVVHNCTINGKILQSGLFDEVYAQPVAHDAGGALGAAWWAYYSDAKDAPRPRLPHLFLGPNIGGGADVARELDRWDGLIDFKKSDDIAFDAAKLLANGAVIGWVQGRSEFGPRALGNRSILADPRPPENKLLINAMVKKREQFRPFAPSVLEERAAEYFEMPANHHKFPYMIFVLGVREQMRETLGAVTHVDGTARVQTVSRDTNPLYWRLIDEFCKITGLPVVLNTSFNNNAEPIVDSVDDAVVCFLTTGLHYLAVGDYLVAKRPVEQFREALLKLVPALPAHYKLVWREKADLPETGGRPLYEIEGLKSGDFGGYTRSLAPATFAVLRELGRERTLGELINDAGISSAEEERSILTEIQELWTSRVIRLRPAVARSRQDRELADSLALA